jgi:hypothetical protein
VGLLSDEGKAARPDHRGGKIKIIRPYKINYLVLRPIFPIFDAGGQRFFLLL